jgi:GT2 family glycosyltransferase
MTVSFLMVTIDRFDLTPNVWTHNMATARMNLDHRIKFEGLICDNGSTDRRIVSHFAGQGLAYHRINVKNEGVGRAFNQLYLRSTGKFIAILGNDIKMPPGWLNAAISMLTWTPKPGLVGFNWGHGIAPPVSKRFNMEAHWLNEKYNRVFGAWIFRRELVEQIGLFHEGYGPYGIEDTDVNERANRLGFNSCYVPNMMSEHVGWDVGHQTEYRRSKDESLKANCAIYNHRLSQWDAGTLPLVEPLPETREPFNG